MCLVYLYGARVEPKADSHTRQMSYLLSYSPGPHDASVTIHFPRSTDQKPCPSTSDVRGHFPSISPHTFSLVDCSSFTGASAPGVLMLMYLQA